MFIKVFPWKQTARAGVSVTGTNLNVPITISINDQILDLNVPSIYHKNINSHRFSVSPASKDGQARISNDLL